MAMDLIGNRVLISQVALPDELIPSPAVAESSWKIIHADFFGQVLQALFERRASPSRRILPIRSTGFEAFFFSTKTRGCSIQLAASSGQHLKRCENGDCE